MITFSLVAPLVLSEVNANQNLHIRCFTSLRHHTVLHHPIIGFEHEDKIINYDALYEQFCSFVKNSIRLTKETYQLILITK